VSKYRVVKTECHSPGALVEAWVDLLAREWARRRGVEVTDELIAEARVEVEANIEIHDEAVQLEGYESRLRDERAHVVLRRAWLNKHLTGASNDIGFALDEDGCYQEIVSDYDNSVLWRRCGNRFYAVAGAEEFKELAAAEGFDDFEIIDNGEDEIEVIAEQVPVYS
jgi:hypothetical protein